MLHILSPDFIRKIKIQLMLLNISYWQDECMSACAYVLSILLGAWEIWHRFYCCASIWYTCTHADCEQLCIRKRPRVQ